MPCSRTQCSASGEEFRLILEESGPGKILLKQFNRRQKQTTFIVGYEGSKGYDYSPSVPHMKTRSKTIENIRYFLSPCSIHNRFETKMIIHLSPLYFTRDFLPDYHVRIKTVIWNYMDKP